MRPGPLRLSLEKRGCGSPAIRCAICSANAGVPDGQALLTNQTFRDIYQADTLDVDQWLKITSLTFLFTDLKCSTVLYERVGDLVAYGLVRQHFHVLYDVVAAEAGAVVKTVGDVVMATFPTPDRALTAALRMREEMARINSERMDEIDKPFLLDLWRSTGDRVAKSWARGCQPGRAAITVAPHWGHPCAVFRDDAAAIG